VPARPGLGVRPTLLKVILRRRGIACPGQSGHVRQTNSSA
jgi:hypothetical protein